MNIVLACDREYEIFLATIIASILTNAGENDIFIFYILNGGISGKARRNIEKLKTIKDFSILYIEVDQQKILNCPVSPEYHFSIAAYYRFMIGDILQHEKRALYLDVDMIVLGSLAELHATDLRGFVLGAVPQNAGCEQEDNIRLGLSRDNTYFNSGVLLIDLEKWRCLDIFSSLLETTERIASVLKWVDQDVFNVYFENNFYVLEQKWNYASEFVTQDTQCAIVHFMGSDKFGVDASKYLHQYVAKTPYRAFPQHYARPKRYMPEDSFARRIRNALKPLAARLMARAAK